MSRTRMENWSGSNRAIAAFTLIELLVVISIIGLLAGLVLGVGGVVARQSQSKPIQAQLEKLVFRIESYKGALGMYPPDNPRFPSTNQLFYELSGAVYQPDQTYQTMDRVHVISRERMNVWFNTEGIANSARDPQDVKYTMAEGFKPNEYLAFKPNEDSGVGAPVAVEVVVLVAPRAGPRGFAGNPQVNTWNYVSTNPTNNVDRFDLWVDVLIGGKTNRFSNWSKGAVVIYEP